MANPYVFEFSSLTGGVDGALDSLNTTSIPDESHAKVDTGSIVYTYVFSSASSATESSPEIIAPDTGSGRWLLSTSSEQANQADVDILANGPGYWFDGVDDYVSVANNANLNMGTGDQSIVSSFKNIGNGGEINSIYSRFHAGSDNDGLFFQIKNTGYIHAYFEVDDVAINVNTNGKNIGADGKNHIGVLTLDRDSSTGLKLFLDGSEETYSLQGDPTLLSGDCSPTSPGYVGIGYNGSISPFAGSIFSTKLFNLALDNTDPTDKAIINGGAIPCKYIGASQAEQTSGTLVIGKSYRINNWITADHFTNVGGSNVDGTKFVATATTPTTWTNSSTVVRIGCVLDLNNTGVTASQWLDNSGNELHGAVSGALPTNLSANDVQRYRHTVAITDDTTWTDIVPAGYMLEAITFVESAGNAATIDLGTTSGASDVFSQEVIAASGITVVTIDQAFSMTAKQSLYLNDDGAGTWNSASITATLTLRRLI